jgi:2-methylcitrate dehydratase PrpD
MEDERVPPSRPAVADLSAPLADHVAAGGEASIPPEVLSAEKLYLLDWIAVVAVGIGAPGCAELARLLERMYGDCGASRALFGVSAPAPEMAMLSTAHAQAWEIDDVYDEALVRPHSLVVSGTLAVARMLADVSPSRLLVSNALGTDVLCRLARGATSPLSWSRTTTLGTIAVAAACAKLLDLDADGIRNAMGVAYCQSAGTLQPGLEGTSAKRLQAGFAARAGVLSALLAAEGVDGPHEALEGKLGYYRQYERDQYDREAVLEGLGDHLLSCAASIRTYPGARESHAAYEAARRLIETEQSLSGIRRVRIFLTEDAANVVANPIGDGAVIAAAALASAAYGTACILTRGHLDIAVYGEDARGDPDILRVARSTSFATVEDARAGAITPARVAIELSDGRELSAEVTKLPAGVDERSTDAVIAKFRQYFGQYCAKNRTDRVQALLDTVLTLEQRTIRELFSLLQ